MNQKIKIFVLSFILGLVSCSSTLYGIAGIGDWRAIPPGDDTDWVRKSKSGKVSQHNIFIKEDPIGDLERDSNPRVYGAICDGVTHFLSSRYTTLAQAQLVYPFVTNINTQTIDWAALQIMAISNIAIQLGSGYDCMMASDRPALQFYP